MTLNRRSFIQRTVAGAAAGAAAAQNLARPAEAPAPIDQAPSMHAVDSFSFCVIADPHCSEPMRSAVERFGTALDRLMACFGEIEGLEGADKPDFALLAGDVHPWLLKDHMDRIPIPIHAVAGNHESTREKRQQMRDLAPGDFKPESGERDYYSFVHKGARFIALCDAGAGGEHVGQFCSELIRPAGQCEWLEAELARPEPTKIVLAHIPPEPEGLDRNMFMSRNDSRWFNALVERTRPTAMFFGHLHQPTRHYRIGATECYNVRSCCWNGGQADLGFLLVRVTPEGVSTREIITGAFDV